jgi:hypothetical protein
MIGRLVAGLVVALVAGLVLGGCQGGPAAGPVEGVDGGAAFERIKALAGDWQGRGSHSEDVPASTKFELTSSGSVVKETMFPGTPHEMVNMYSLDRGSLVMTHYCAMGNQPHLRLAAVEGNVYTLEFIRGGNLASRDEPHMDSMVMTLDGPDHVTSVWTSWANGGPTGDQAAFDLRRVKSGGQAAR